MEKFLLKLNSLLSIGLRFGTKVLAHKHRRSTLKTAVTNFGYYCLYFLILSLIIDSVYIQGGNIVKVEFSEINYVLYSICLSQKFKFGVKFYYSIFNLN